MLLQSHQVKAEAGRLAVEHIPFELDRVLETAAGVIAERAVLARLTGLLNDSDADAVDLLTEEAAPLRRALGRAYDEVLRAATAYDFDLPVGLVREAIRAHA